MFIMESTILLVDAGYLSHISKFFGKGKHLKYKLEKFAVNLCEEIKLDCKEIYFYTAPPFQNPKPTKEENKRKANYDRFILKLKRASPKVNIREGRLQKINGAFTQKGVDTLMTMDLLRIGQRKEVKQVIVITSDTDFVPIIEDVRKNSGLKVFLAYFTDRKRKSSFSLSNHLWKVVDKKFLIKKDHFSSNES